MFTDCCSEGVSGEGVGLGGMGEVVSWGWLTGGRKVEAGRLSVRGGVAGGDVQLVSVSSVIIREKMVFLISTRQSGRAGCYVKKFRSQPSTKTESSITGIWRTIGSPKNHEKFVNLVLKEKDVKELVY